MTEQHLGATRIAGPDACYRVLLVGELNPYGTDPRYALYHEPPNSAGGRLQRVVLGLPARHWYLPIWRANLCVGDWDWDEARLQARNLWPVISDGIIRPWQVVILLGEKVRAAFPDPVPMQFGATISGGSNLPLRTVVCLPHPSGRNARAYDLANIEHARSLLREVLPDIPWGSLDQETSE